MDDGRIVELFLERDESALELVQEKYGARLKALAFRVLGDAGAAEECLNDALLEAWGRIPPHEPREYLFAFLARLVRAKALNAVKAGAAKKRSAELVSLTEELSDMLNSGDDIEAEVEARELAEAVGNFLAGVSAEKRRVFIRRYWLLESIDEIAKGLSMHPARVKSMLFRMRRELKKYLEKEGLL